MKIKLDKLFLKLIKLSEKKYEEIFILTVLMGFWVQSADVLIADAGAMLWRYTCDIHSMKRLGNEWILHLQNSSAVAFKNMQDLPEAQ